MKKRLSLVCFVILGFAAAAQINRDSLWMAWNDSSNSDSLRLKAIGRLSFYRVFSDPDSAFYLAGIQLKFADSIKNQKYVADAYNTQGASFYMKGDYDEAIQYFDKGLRIFKQIDDVEDVGNVLNNISGVYVNLHEYNEALKYLLEGKEYFDKTKYGIGQAMTYANLGSTYLLMGESEDENSVNWKYLDSSYYFLKKALAKSEEINYQMTLANSLGNIGAIYYYKGQLDSARYYLHRSIDLKEQLNNQEGVAEELVYLSSVERKGGNLSQSMVYGKQALEIAEKLEIKVVVQNASRCLYLTCKELGNVTEALQYYEKYVQAKKEIEKEDNQRAVIRQQYRYAYQKTALADSLAHANEMEIARVEIEKRRNFQLVLIIGLVMLAGFTFVLYNRFKIIRTQKKTIEEAHAELGVKNKEIMDSIQYAKRIQRAILPSDSILKQELKKVFVFYQPKDVVAGDFYWIDDMDGYILFAVADCTGHGVPGALVSMLCNNALKRSVRDYGLSDPGKILDKTREIVVQEFEKSAEEVKDGMDISLCSIKGNKVLFAGANNPLWIYRKNDKLFEEIKGDRQPVGKHDSSSSFTTHEVSFEPGDRIFLFSDGFADQFGGPKGKKLRSAGLKELLLSIADKPLEEHPVLLEEAFRNWKGSNEQIDDVCLMTVEV